MTLAHPRAVAWAAVGVLTLVYLAAITLATARPADDWVIAAVCPPTVIGGIAALIYLLGKRGGPS